MSERVAGGCLCGAVRFEIELPVRFCAHCHCSMCRRAHGAPLVTFCGVPDAQFAFSSGEEELVAYESSPGATRSFCRHCGSTLLFRADRWAGEVHVVVANIDGSIGMEPMAHVYFDHRATFFEPGDDLPKRGGASGVEPLG